MVAFHLPSYKRRLLGYEVKNVLIYHARFITQTFLFVVGLKNQRKHAV